MADSMDADLVLPEVATTSGVLLNVTASSAIRVNVTTEFVPDQFFSASWPSGWVLMEPKKSGGPCGGLPLLGFDHWEAPGFYYPASVPVGNYVMAAYSDGNQTQLGMSAGQGSEHAGVPVDAAWAGTEIPASKTPLGWAIDWVLPIDSQQIAIVTIGRLGALPPVGPFEASLASDNGICWSTSEAGVPVSSAGSANPLWIGGGGMARGETIRIQAMWEGPAAIAGTLTGGLTLISSADLVEVLTS